MNGNVSTIWKFILHFLVNEEKKGVDLQRRQSSQWLLLLAAALQLFYDSCIANK